MTLVTDLGPRFCKLGVSGEDKPNSRVPAYVGYPTSPPDLNFEEVSSMPVDTLTKSDKLDVFPIITASQNAMEFDPKTLRALTTYLACGQSSLLLSSPAISDQAFMSGIAELIFDGTTGYTHFLPQDSAVTSAFGCGRVTSMVLEVQGCCTSFSAVSEGTVCARAQTTKDNCDEVIRAAITKADMAPPFPYSKKKNPFVSASFLDLSRVNQVYEKPAVLPDGALVDVGRIAGLPKLINEVLKNESVTTEMACTVVACGEAIELAREQLTLGENLHEIASPSDPNYGWRVIRGGNLSSWFGGSILGSLSVYGSVAVDSSMWAEYGRSLWARKGF